MKRLAFALLVLCAVPTSAIAQSVLDSVRELYASADYQGALAALSRVKEVRADSSVVSETDHYRVLCLMALNRLSEAERVIETILTKDPLYHPSAEEAAPRVRAAFDQVRRRVMPLVARRLYEEGKLAFEREAFTDAVDLLERALRIMNDSASADTPGLSDYKVLATGFRDLSQASLAVRAAAPLPNHGGSGKPATPAASTTDPVAVRQVLPPWPGAAAGPQFDREFMGTVEIKINAAGNVTAARIITPIHASYDQQLLRAARTWLYEPARRAGVAVPSTKRFDILLRPREGASGRGPGN